MWLKILLDCNPSPVSLKISSPTIRLVQPHVSRGQLALTVTKYMPVWCSILLSSWLFLGTFQYAEEATTMFLGLVMAACLYTTKKPVGFNSYSHCNALVFLDLAKYSPRFLLIFLIRYQSFLPFCNYNKGVDI